MAAQREHEEGLLWRKHKARKKIILIDNDHLFSLNRLLFSMQIRWHWQVEYGAA